MFLSSPCLPRRSPSSPPKTKKAPDLNLCHTRLQVGPRFRLSPVLRLSTLPAVLALRCVSTQLTAYRSLVSSPTANFFWLFSKAARAVATKADNVLSNEAVPNFLHIYWRRTCVPLFPQSCACAHIASQFRMNSTSTTTTSSAM